MLKLKSIGFGEVRIFLGHGCHTLKIRVLHLELEPALRGPGVLMLGLASSDCSGVESSEYGEDCGRLTFELRPD